MQVRHWRRPTRVLIDQLIAKGKYGWQAFGAQDGVGQGVSKDSVRGLI